MAGDEPATHPLLPSSHLWQEMSPPPTLFTYVQFTLRTFATIEECLLGFDNPLCMFALHRSTTLVTMVRIRTRTRTNTGKDKDLDKDHYKHTVNEP